MRGTYCTVDKRTDYCSMKFHKYQGAGNDFVFLDSAEWTERVPGPELIRSLCDRRFGVGADGVILLQSEPGYDFRMRYYNADGLEGSFCGNGGRCAVLRARESGLIEEEARFLASDGAHRGRFSGDLVEIEMQSGAEPVKLDFLSELGCEAWFADTGSPHLVLLGSPFSEEDWLEGLRALRHHPRFAPDGVNVNQATPEPDGSWSMRTFERGVEAETLACGTGTVALARVLYRSRTRAEIEPVLRARGGVLRVRLKPLETGFANCSLIGPAVCVYEGIWKQDRA